MSGRVDLAALKKLVAGALRDRKGVLVCTCTSGAGDDWLVYHCALHQEAVNVLPRLLTEVESLRAQLAAVERERDEFQRLLAEAGRNMKAMADAHTETANEADAAEARVAEVEGALRRLEAIASHIGEEISWQPVETGGDAVAWAHGEELGEACKQARAALRATPGGQG